MGIARLLMAVVVGIVATAVIFISLFSIAPVCGVQYAEFSTERWVKVNEIIVYGTIVSADMKLAQSEYSSNPTDITARAYFKIRADKYLVDKSGNFADYLIFSDRSVHGCVYPFRSEFDIEHRETVSYDIGEKSLFFLYRGGDGALTLTGFLSKFDIEGDTIQAKRDRIRGYEPFQITQFENDILRYAEMTSSS